MASRTRPPLQIRSALVVLAALAGLLVAAGPRLSGQGGPTGWKVVAWNNLGMHCMDADFSVFAILPPYNTIEAQVIDSNGRLVTSSAGLQLTYEGVADPTGSLNTTSAWKTNFWSFIQPLFGVTLPADVGLLNHNMPGATNVPQPMTFDPALRWFIAEGIPITPYDAAAVKNPYPMMKVTATDSTGAVLASTNIVLPVSDEMDCTVCHASGSGPAAQPNAGWVNLIDPLRDYRLNILRLHDDRQRGTAAYASALAAKGYASAGLEASATGGKQVLCAACHRSEALAGSGIDGIPPLTSSMHLFHAPVVDPTSNLTLDSSSNRSACYRCHPGAVTRCLRGAMGNAVALDGTMAIQCQDCHGRMSVVGSLNRTGWLQEPTCQQCHTGTAVLNSGQLRYTSAFLADGHPRAAADLTFATAANTPAPGLSLYRFSSGHGGLQCSACHGSTHAEYPSAHANDNLQSLALQGHIGTLAECGSCHTTVPTTINGGPHGMHPVGPTWVSRHPDAADNPAPCRVCHGTDYRGTVLSRASAVRTLSTSFGTKALFRGSLVGCYMCHNGPGSESANPNRAAIAGNLSTSTAAGVSVDVALTASDADGNVLTFRIVSQPEHGTVGLSGTTATYFPYAGFLGTDTFTYAAWDGSIDSNLATVTVQVGSGPGGCSLTSAAAVPLVAVAGTPVSFIASATPTGCTSPVTYTWIFGDGSVLSPVQAPTHSYTSAGAYLWTMTASASGASSVRTGTIVVADAPSSAPAVTSITPAAGRTIGGTPVRIGGSNFVAGAAVTIGGVSAPVSSVTATEILATTGPHAAGPASVTVTNPDLQSATLAGAFTYVVPTPRLYHLAEGATVWTFDTRLAIANLGSEPAPVTITFMREGGTTVQANLTVAVGARETLRVADVPGMAYVSFGTLVESTAGTPLAVERTMTWDAGHGAHLAAATETLGLQWYFAEGVQGAFDTYLVMANPGDVAADVTVTFLPEGGAPVVRTAQVGPRSRVTLWAGMVPELLWHSFSTVIDATQPIVAERAIYFGSARFWDGGTAAMGVTTLSTDWHFAEGATGGIFSLYLLLFNPNAADAMSTVTYLFPDGTTEQHTYPVAARSRRTIWVNGESAALAWAMGLAMHVHSDLPLTAERAMYWPSVWQEGHASAGSSPALVWGLAEGRVGGPENAQTFIVLANPGDTASEVRVTYLREFGLPPVVKTYTVNATSRLTVFVNGLVPEMANENFGALLEVTNGVPLVVERSVYWDAGGQVWAAGTNGPGIVVLR